MKQTAQKQDASTATNYFKEVTMKLKDPHLALKKYFSEHRETNGTKCRDKKLTRETTPNHRVKKTAIQSFGGQFNPLAIS